MPRGRKKERSENKLHENMFVRKTGGYIRSSIQHELVECLLCVCVPGIFSTGSFTFEHCLGKKHTKNSG